MTADRHEDEPRRRRQPLDGAETLQGMVDWLDAELRQLKAHVNELTEQAERDRGQLWGMTDRLHDAETVSVNMGAQLSTLTSQMEEVRALRDRVERLQNVLGQDQEQRDGLSRQLRSEMQAERDERNEVARRADFAEQSVKSVREKFVTAEETLRRLQDELTVVHQRLEQSDLNIHAVDARIAANAEAIRRMQGEGRTQQGEAERLGRALHDMGERLESMQQAMRRMQEVTDRSEERDEEFEALKARVDDLRRVVEDATAAQANASRAREAQDERLAELERTAERLRARDTQRDREILELRQALEAARETNTREAERFLGLQEKIRRRQIQDLEQEIRELKGYGRTTPNA